MLVNPNAKTPQPRHRATEFSGYAGNWPIGLLFLSVNTLG